MALMILWRLVAQTALFLRAVALRRQANSWGPSSGGEARAATIRPAGAVFAYSGSLADAGSCGQTEEREAMRWGYPPPPAERRCRRR